MCRWPPDLKLVSMCEEGTGASVPTGSTGLSSWQRISRQTLRLLFSLPYGTGLQPAIYCILRCRVAADLNQTMKNTLITLEAYLCGESTK